VYTSFQNPASAQSPQLLWLWALLLLVVLRQDYTVAGLTCQVSISDPKLQHLNQVPAQKSPQTCAVCGLLALMALIAA